MTENLLIEAYKKKQAKRGIDAYKYMVDIFAEAEEKHKLKLAKLGESHRGQSWHFYKGKHFEKLIEHITKNEVRKFGLKMMGSDMLYGNSVGTLSCDLERIRRSLLIDYGEYGCCLPDIDIAIYDPIKKQVQAVIAVKATFRDKITESCYWKTKMQSQSLTKHIKFYFIAADYGRASQARKPAERRSRIMQIDLDGSYVCNMLEKGILVKRIGQFIEDLRKLKP